ncbi:histidine--tRNA ligase [Candidatus Saccharibacteria bacterium]|nr:histidine--tRNA ligase [Candidatus Saccharibacteria bacterium]MBR3378058.1 histidine--tRNA ligase [Candidatus Saccharibacteria bacterium]
MKRINTSPLSGMQELLPTEQAIFDQLKQQISDVYHHYGFLNIETPIIERSEVLLAKAGGDTEKQIYMVSKTAESADSADQALRFDHTVPLARYIVEHNNNLAFPFQVTQIGRNFRGERAQRGRFREFYQCDCDIIGREKLPIAYDAKVIACIHDALKTFDLPEMNIRISNRKVLSGFLTAIKTADKAAEISNIIDHAEKVPLEKSRAALEELRLTSDQVEKIIAFMFTNGSYAEIEAKLTEIIGDLTPVREGLNELEEVFDILNSIEGMSDIIIDFMIIRGLDYYTGTVYETFLKDYREIGSISSGGRYENLAGNFSDQKFPGVGGSIGLTRLFYVLNEQKLLNTETSAPVDYVILPLSSAEYSSAIKLANQLRAKGNAVDIDFDDRKLGNKFNRAAKIAKYAIVVGSDEAASGNYQAKDLATGETKPLAI